MARAFEAFILAVSIMLVAPFPGVGAALAGKRHVAVELLADRSPVTSGEPLTLAVKETIEPGWHTYWVNPGDSGEPTTVEWSLPDGASAGPLQWPVPQTIPIGAFVNYGFEDRLILLAPLHIPQAQLAGPLSIGATVRLLVCKDICVPEESKLDLTLDARAASGPSASASEIDAARAALPLPLPGQATFAPFSAGEVDLDAAVPQGVLEGVREARFFPQAEALISSAAPQRLQLSAGGLSLRMQKSDDAAMPVRLDGVLVLTKADGKRAAYAIAAAGGRHADLQPAVATATPSGGSAAGAVEYAAPAGGVDSIGAALLFAFLGGLILNLMPCVFPVLALKALSFASRRDAGTVLQGLAYLGGVMACFAGFAIVLALLKSGGHALGWGFQFQTPSFVLVLAILFFVLGLNLSGAVSFGSALTGVGDDLTRRPGLTGTFFTGYLAALAATPCTAPLMGAAIGYAIAQSTGAMVAVVLTLGLGFATPVVALSLSPRLQRSMPRPGAWMETLKEVLAFPLYATAAWLIWVLSLQTGADGVLAAAAAIVGVGFAAWLANKTALSALSLRLVAPVLGVAFVVAAAASLPSAETGQDRTSKTAGLLHEEAFSQARLDELLLEGRPVFVNLTAAWCITCKVNERVALRSPDIARAFEGGGIVYLKGDWTKANPEITALLDRFGRAGVPLYIFYPGHGLKPRILPQFLTAGIVLDEIAAAGGSSPGGTAKRA